jgi:hypothetical protein
MQIINVLMSLCLIAMGLVLILTVLQFGFVAVFAILGALSWAFTAISDWVRGNRK